MSTRGDILTLDLASSTGFAEGPPGEKPRSGSFKLADAGASHGERYAALFRWLWTRCSAFPPREIVFEAPMPPSFARGQSNIDTASLLMGLPAVVETVAQLKGIYSVRKANVQDVRQFFIGGRGFIHRGKPITGRRNLKSAEAKWCVMERCRELGHEPTTTDEGDALALHYYVSSIRAPASAAEHTPLFEHPGAAA